MFRQERRRNNNHPSSQPASTCPTEQRSTPVTSKAATFAAGENNKMQPEKNDPVFPFLQLPAELREQVYLFVIQPITPIDTAAIPDTPDRVRIPPVAHVSSQLREEALHVLFRNRPVEISLHSTENRRRALLWATKWAEHSGAFGLIIFSGRLEQSQYEFFHITLERSDDAPYFRVRTRPGASGKANILIAQIKEELLKWLDQKVAVAIKGQEGKLSGGAIANMIHLVDNASRLHPVAKEVS